MASKNFPIIASRTFERFRKDNQYLKIAKDIIKRLRKVRDVFKRVRIVHREVDRHLGEVFENPVTSQLSCKAGCSACCHSQVGITEDESEVLAQKILEGHPVDLRIMSLQAEAGNNNAKWFELPFELRRCVFLDRNEMCSIYEERPMVCRTNYVFNDPAACKTDGDSINTLRLLNTHKADMVIMGAFEAAKNSGVLASMIWKALKSRGHVEEREKKFPFAIPFKEL